MGTIIIIVKITIVHNSIACSLNNISANGHFVHCCACTAII